MRILPAIGLLVACSPSLAQSPMSPAVRDFVKVDSAMTALTHIRVIDGTGSPAQEDQTVVIAGGKIQSIAAANSAHIPTDAKVIDLTGKSVIPGLVGMHDHMFYPAGGAIFHEMAFSFPRLYLAAGVTTIRTGGSIDPYADLALKKKIDEGAIPGPKIHVTGPYLEGKGTFGLQLHELSGPEDAQRTVEYWADEGVTSFKAYNFLTRAELKSAIDAAHKRHLTLTGHLCSIGFREAAGLGIDNLEHGLVVDTEFYSGKKPDECPSPQKAAAELSKMDVASEPIQSMIRDLVAHHVAVTSTLPVFEQFVVGRPAPAQRVLNAMSADARNQYLQIRVRLSDSAAAPPLPGPRCSSRKCNSNVSSLRPADF